MIKQYLYLIVAVLLAAVIFGSYQFGKSNERASWELKMVEAELKIKELESRAPIITEKIVTEYVDRIKYIDRVKVEVATIKEFVTVENDASCSINNGFVQLHNAAAAAEYPGAPNERTPLPSGVELSEVLQTVTDNYHKYHETKTQLESLQKWIREQQAAWNK